MNQQPILVPATRLAKSPTNVRRSSDADTGAQLNVANTGFVRNAADVTTVTGAGLYSAAKKANESFAESWAPELAPRDIAVNAMR